MPSKSSFLAWMIDFGLHGVTRNLMASLGMHKEGLGVKFHTRNNNKDKHASFRFIIVWGHEWGFHNKISYVPIIIAQAAARVACPHNLASCSGVNHLSLKWLQERCSNLLGDLLFWFLWGSNRGVTLLSLVWMRNNLFARQCKLYGWQCVDSTSELHPLYYLG